MVPFPTVLGLVICERVIVEEGTKSISLVSCFGKLVVDDVPTIPRPFVVFATLTDGRGDATIDLVITNVETGEEVHVLRGGVRFPSPLAKVHLSVRVNDCSFPAAGLYEIDLLVDGESLARRDVRITLRET